MTTTTAAILYAIGGTAAITAAIGAVLQSMTEVSWKDLASGGSAVMVIAVVVIFLRDNAAARQESVAASAARDETLKHVTNKYAESIESATERFADTTTRLFLDRKHTNDGDQHR